MASSSQPAHGFIMFHPLTLWCHHCRGGTYPRTRQGSGSIAGNIIEVHAWKLSSATFDCRRLVVIKKSPQAIFSETCAPTRYNNSPMSVLAGYPYLMFQSFSVVNLVEKKQKNMGLSENRGHPKRCCCNHCNHHFANSNDPSLRYPCPPKNDIV